MDARITRRALVAGLTTAWPAIGRTEAPLDFVDDEDAVRRLKKTMAACPASLVGASSGIWLDSENSTFKARASTEA